MATYGQQYGHQKGVILLEFVKLVSWLPITRIVLAQYTVQVTFFFYKNPQYHAKRIMSPPINGGVLNPHNEGPCKQLLVIFDLVWIPHICHLRMFGYIFDEDRCHILINSGDVSN